MYQISLFKSTKKVLIKKKIERLRDFFVTGWVIFLTTVHTVTAVTTAKNILFSTFGKRNLTHVTTDMMFSGQRFAIVAMFLSLLPLLCCLVTTVTKISLKKNLLKKFHSKNFTWIISLKIFQSNTFSQKISIEKYQSTNFTQKISLGKFHSKNFTWKIAIKNFTQ